MTLVRVRMQINPRKCRFTLIWSHFDSSLASKCHSDPTSESKRQNDSIRGVKMTLRNNSVEMTPPGQNDSCIYSV